MLTVTANTQNTLQHFQGASAPLPLPASPHGDRGSRETTCPRLLCSSAAPRELNRWPLELTYWHPTVTVVPPPCHPLYCEFNSAYWLFPGAYMQCWRRREAVATCRAKATRERLWYRVCSRPTPPAAVHRRRGSSKFSPDSRLTSHSSTSLRRPMLHNTPAGATSTSHEPAVQLAIISTDGVNAGSSIRRCLLGSIGRATL